MSYTLTNELSATVEYNTNYAYNNSWVKVLNDAGVGGVSKPLYAQASYITNMSEMSIGSVSVGSIDIKDPVNTSVKANVTAASGGLNGIVTFVGNKNVQAWGFLSISATTSTWVQLTSQAARSVMIYNNTGDVLDLSRSSSGTPSFPVPDNSTISIDLIGNCNEIYIRNNTASTKTVSIIYTSYN